VRSRQLKLPRAEKVGAASPFHKQEELMPTRLATESPELAEIRALLQQGEDYMASLYASASNHMLDVSALLQPAVTFLVARRDGVAVGCGALVGQADGTCEIKRMFVSPAARGQSVARALLTELEARARRSGARVLCLETGIRQPEAIGLYRSAGFSECGPFGNYQPDPLSIFMEKALAPQSAA
jgi:putative acetyltransferase